MKGKKLQTEERHKGLQHQGTARPAERSTGRHSPRRVLHSSAERKGLTCPGRAAGGAGAGQEHMHCGMGTKRPRPGGTAGTAPLASPLRWVHTPWWERACPERGPGRAEAAGPRWRLQAQNAQRSHTSAGSEGCSARASRCPRTAAVPQGFARCHTGGQQHRAPSGTPRGKERARCSEQPLEMAELDPSERFSSGVSVTLLAKH